ncbi:MAG: transglycosylase SLT domain-containing protein [Janthinobacterium lividum]
MKPAPPLLLLAFAASALGCARAQVAPMAAVSDAAPERWASAAAGSADPLAPRLATYLRLVGDRTGAPDPGVAARFLAENPSWPNRAVIARRLSDGIAASGADEAVLPLCAQGLAGTAAALLRCAEGQARAGRTDAAAGSARAAWEAGLDDPAAEAAFLSAWSGALTPASQEARFERLVGVDTPAAARQAARLEPAARRVAEARLALRRDDAGAMALVAALPAEGRRDPGLVLDEARFLRRGDASGAAALAEWRAEGVAAEEASAPARQAGFRTERELLARRLLRAGDAAGALALMQDEIAVAAQDGGAEAADAEFLAGWIALRRLGDTAGAAGHFAALAAGSRAAISQGRAHYWLGRTAAARGDAAGAQAEYVAAAAWPLTFYGQLGAIAADGVGAESGAAEVRGEAGLRARLAALRDPAWTPEEALAFSGSELARAGELLVAWGEARRARAFLLRLGELAPDARTRSLAAALALRLAEPDVAVAAARLAGRAGGMLPRDGWPVDVPGDVGEDGASGVERGVVLGFARQESSFDPEAVSPSGARGLMQLMPATAQEVAHRLGVAASTAALTADPALNVRLGSAYLAGLLGRNGGVLPYAAAAYNAGPTRLREWLAAGDPAAGGGDMIDWIEMIPAGETRNYVQRVIENVVDYRARLGVVAPHPLARWLG